MSYADLGLFRNAQIMGIGAILPAPDELGLETRDGLTYVRPSSVDLIDQALQAMFLQVSKGEPISGKLIPSIGGGAKDAIKDFVAQGHVVMISKSDPTSFLMTRSAMTIANLTKAGGEWAIYKGPKALVDIAQASAAVSAAPFWVWPVVVGLGGAILLLAIRR